MSPAGDADNLLTNETKVETVNKIDLVASEPVAPTATELLSASIEKVAKEQPLTPAAETEPKELLNSAIEAQAKLTQSLASCLRTYQSESKMKDINLNNKTTG